MRDNGQGSYPEGSAFDRLPQKIKDEIRQKERQQEVEAARYQERMKKKILKGTVFGGVAAVILGAINSFGNPVFIIIMAAYGTACSYAIVRRQLNHLACILLYGLGSIVLSLIGFAAGLVPLHIFWIGCWGFYILVGPAIGIWARVTETDTIPYQGE